MSMLTVRSDAVSVCLRQTDFGSFDNHIHQLDFSSRSICAFVSTLRAVRTMRSLAAVNPTVASLETGEKMFVNRAGS